MQGVSVCVLVKLSVSYASALHLTMYTCTVYSAFQLYEVFIPTRLLSSPYFVCSIFFNNSAHYSQAKAGQAVSAVWMATPASSTSPSTLPASRLLLLALLAVAAEAVQVSLT